MIMAHTRVIFAVCVGFGGLTVVLDQYSGRKLLGAVGVDRICDHDQRELTSLGFVDMQFEIGLPPRTTRRR